MHTTGCGVLGVDDMVCILLDCWFYNLRKMKRIGIVMVLLLIVVGVRAQEGGIKFETGSWQELREKAIRENKLIFVDFYTEWCGPCLAMAEEVFPLLEVGNFYNSRFVNVKIDAEKGEGKTLREKYKVVSYPTFLFIDARSGEVVHRSSSRQEKETFLFTGKSAVTPALRSPYLEKEYQLGNREPELLVSYMDYLASVYQREKVQELVKVYTGRPEFTLKNRDDWKVFVKHIGGTGNPQFSALLKDKEMYVALYGVAEVDGKLYQEFNQNLDTGVLMEAPDFRGKDFLLKKNRAEKYLRARDYESAVPMLDALMAEPGGFKEELCRYLKFTARSVLYGEYPAAWIRKCAELAQYVAYNSDNRQDAGVHYDYAMILEKLIRTVPDAGAYFPASITDKPEKGATEYSLRSSKLKEKPKKR